MRGLRVDDALPPPASAAQPRPLQTCHGHPQLPLFHFPLSLVASPSLFLVRATTERLATCRRAPAQPPRTPRLAVRSPSSASTPWSRTLKNATVGAPAMPPCLLDLGFAFLPPSPSRCRRLGLWSSGCSMLTVAPLRPEQRSRLSLRARYT